MRNHKKVVVVMPAYNAEKTLEKTCKEIDQNWVDEILVVDDCSTDNTVTVAKSLNLKVIRHDTNKGYGGNQKTCYRTALEMGADIVVMLHPDYQYTPKLLPAMISVLTSDLFEVSLGSRILGGGALRGGMPLYKYFFNRILTFSQNLLTGMKLSEFHTGYRAFKREVLEALPLAGNSDDFVFDNQMLVQAHFAGFRIAEITCPTLYFEDASSINFSRSLKYGFGCLWTSVQYLLARFRLGNFILFPRKLFKVALSQSWPEEQREKRLERMLKSAPSASYSASDAPTAHTEETATAALFSAGDPPRPNKRQDFPLLD